MQEPRRIVLKQSTTLRLCGSKRKAVTDKTEIMYIPILDTLQAQLNNATVFQEVCACIYKQKMIACMNMNYHQHQNCSLSAT